MEDNYSTRTFSYHIPTTAMNVYKNDRKKVQAVMKGVFGLILKGVKIELAYLKFKGRNGSALQCDWEDKIKRLIDKMKSYDSDVKAKWYSQMNQDIPAMLSEFNGQSHPKFATNLFNFLSYKFDWRDWHVVAFDILSGDNQFRVRFCHGYRNYGRPEHKRNVMVASVDKTKPTIDRNDASEKLNKIKTAGRRSSSKTASFIYNHFPNEYKSGCTFASAGIIATEYYRSFWSFTRTTNNVAHRAPPHRLVLIHKYRNDLHVFG